MNIYRRYFKVTTGPMLASVVEANEINDAAHKEYIKFAQEVGAKDEYYRLGVVLTGFIFDNPPDRFLWKENARGCGYWPKQNTKWGKDLVKRIRQIKTKELSSCLEVVGLSEKPTLFGSGKAYWATLTVIPSIPPVPLVSVPWYDENPDVIEKYKIDRDSGAHRSLNLDFILWAPTADMQEIKHWEYEKIIEEWNDSVRGLNATK